MKRRDVLKGGVAAALATGASAVSAPAIASNQIEITMVSTWPRDFPGLGTGAQRFAERLTAMTDGRIKVNYFAAGERVKAFDSFDEVASGNAQMYHAADYYWKGKHPGWAYFTAVPFGRAGESGVGGIWISGLVGYTFRRWIAFVPSCNPGNAQIIELGHTLLPVDVVHHRTTTRRVPYVVRIGQIVANE